MTCVANERNDMESQPDPRLPGSSTPGPQTAAAESQRPETNGGPAGPKVVERLVDPAPYLPE